MPRFIDGCAAGYASQFSGPTFYSCPGSLTDAQLVTLCSFPALHSFPAQGRSVVYDDAVAAFLSNLNSEYSCELQEMLSAAVPFSVLIEFHSAFVETLRPRELTQYLTANPFVPPPEVLTDTVATHVALRSRFATLRPTVSPIVAAVGPTAILALLLFLMFCS